MERRLVRIAGRRRVGLVSLLGAATIAITSVPSTAHADPTTPPNVKVLSKSVATKAKTYVTPLASSTSTASFGSAWAVYERHNVVGRVLDPTGQLVAVTASGKPFVFGAVTSDMTDFSLSGYTLTAMSETDPTLVYLWQPPYGEHDSYRTEQVRSGDRYLASAPGGWVEIDSSGMLYTDNGGVTPQPLGNPFGSATDVQGVSGPTGVVVWNATNVAFVSFATGAVTPLDTSAVPSGDEFSPECWSASSVAVACGSYFGDGEDDSGLKTIFVDPLDGAPAYAQSTLCPSPATMLDTSAAWVSCKGQVEIIGESTPIHSTAAIGQGLVAGLGGYLTTGVSGHTGMKLSANGKTLTTALPSSAAASEVTEFSLASGRIAWVANTPGSHPATVYRRTVTPNSLETAVKAGSTHSVGGIAVTKGTIASAGSTLVYATKYVSSAVGQNGGEVLRIVMPKRTRTVSGADRYATVDVGTHWLLYFTAQQHARLLDLRNGKTTKLGVQAAALTGNKLAYLDNVGTLRLKNLATGAIKVVTTELGGPDASGGIFVRGNVVGWNGYHLHTLTADNAYVDTSTTAVPTEVPSGDDVWALSDAGIIEEQPVAIPENSPAAPGPNGLRFHPGESFLLQPYDGGTATTLLTGDYLSAGPQVAGGIVAWVTEDGTLEARTL